VHVKALGNMNYRLLSPVKILDYEAGRVQIAASALPVVLMCVCQAPTHCHRTIVADLLRRDGFTVEEIAPTKPHAVQGDLL
jgi:uncharacterized protein (DUF488 family)